MKRYAACFLAVLLAAAMLLGLAACGSSVPENTGDGPKITGSGAAEKKDVKNVADSGSKSTEGGKDKTLPKISVKAEECAESGYQVLLANTAGAIEVTEDSDKEVSWKIYLSDSKLEDPAAELASAEPALEGGGRLNAKRGQYIYVFCSCEEGASYEGASLTFSGKDITR